VAVELAEQLQSLLGSSFTIVRELGGGGMSRVFLADDNALGRSVVIKVLLPELAAGVNAERFKREVQTSARLQHPHIVPVLSAGEVDGLPYYVMPYVKGESLRVRLAAGPMPITQVVSVMSDVAKALAYAASDGIVHRDIKPDNILLSGGAATVADFGIAKAISSARQKESEGLTSLGTSLGTPAYMAPEQVAGDPNVDQRADIYSLGCVAYEMLAGESPFARKSPQQMLAAHVMEKPAPLAERRGGIPSSLIALVNRCLEKEPTARPQSASEIVSQLESSGDQEVVSPTGAARARSKVPTWAMVAGVVLLGAAAVPAYRAMRRPVAADGSIAIAVAPFEVLDPQLALWKEGMVDVLSRNLDGSGPIRAIPPSASIKRWEGHADRSVAAAFGKRVGAQLVVYGQLQPAGRDLVDAKAWIVDTQRDAQPIEVQLRDSIARMDRVTDSLSVRVLAAIGRDRAIGVTRVASLGSGSLPAIKAFLQGSQYFRRTQWDSAALAFQEAVRLDSTFGIAYLHLAQSLGWTRGAGSADVTTAYRRAGAMVRPGLSAHDSLLLTATGHYASAGRNVARNMKETRAAFAAATAAAERYPNDPEAWYLLGDMRYHTDPTLTDREALAYFDRAIAADSDFAPAYIHAIELGYRYGVDVGRRYADAYLRRDPRDVEGEGVRLATLASDPHVSPRELQAVFDTMPERVGQKAFTAISRLPDSAESAIGLLRAGLRRTPEGRGQGLKSLLASELAMHGHISEAWSLGVANKNYIAAEIAGLGLVPADSAAKLLRPLLEETGDASLVPIPVLALVHDTAALIRETAAIETKMHDTSATKRAIMGYLSASFRAYTALARGDTVTATRLFDALPDSIVSLPFDSFVRARLIGRQDPKRAIEILERRGNSTFPDLLYAARQLERGRLAERVGDRERAVDAYSFVAAVWRNAEVAPLRDGAKEASDALKRLDSDGRLRAQLGAVTSR
jgi:tRNA A-37 threonylcarbamoyl transferase component Bud32/tetratricopeptide (TPR) repeat protein